MIAGLFEVCWAVAIKYSEDFSRPIASMITLLAMGLSVVLLANATKSIPIGTAYAVWTSIGAVGVAMYGMIVLGESASPLRLLSLAVIVVGICGLKLTTH